MVLDDSHNEREETLTLPLSNAPSGLADWEASGMIENRDALPRSLAGAVRTDGGGARGRDPAREWSVKIRSG